VAGYGHRTHVRSSISNGCEDAARGKIFREVGNPDQRHLPQRSHPRGQSSGGWRTHWRNQPPLASRNNLMAKGFATEPDEDRHAVRVDGRTVDFSLMEEQKGEEDFHQFSYLPTVHRTLKQRSCWMTYTSEEVHEALREGLHASPLYNGQIQSIGPRYCPSIETKIVTFPDKDNHLLFLEPEGERTNEYYLNGFSSSLPLQTQLNALHLVPAFRNAHIFRPGYAIEYDLFRPDTTPPHPRDQTGPKTCSSRAK